MAAARRLVGSPLALHRILCAHPTFDRNRSTFRFFTASSHETTVLPPVAPHNDASAHGPVFSIDRSGLGTPFLDDYNAQSWKVEQSAMAKHISALIKFRGGPLTVAEYMGEILTNSNAGFYMNRVVFGKHGDFVTSPDVSQMFGEMLGVWSMLLWEQLGQPKEFSLVELGPGRGTLMADLIRGTAKFKEFSQALSVHLVECSPALRKMQGTALKCQSTVEDGGQHCMETTGMPVSWHMHLDQVPRGLPTIIIAHEFYDALPVHQFQKTARGWCEKLVDVGGSEQEFRFVLSPMPTIAQTVYLEKRLQWATKEEKSQLEHVEVCPDAWKLSADIAQRVSEDGGGAIVIDYGDDKLVTDSLQAIRNHQFTNVLEGAGLADLSAFVDFPAIKRAIQEAGAEALVCGPVTQGQFLGRLGINFRLEALLNAATSEEQEEELRLSYWRLVGDGPAPWVEDEEKSKMISGMGSRYKALAIVQSRLGVPVGFY